MGKTKENFKMFGFFFIPIFLHTIQRLHQLLRRRYKSSPEPEPPLQIERNVHKQEKEQVIGAETSLWCQLDVNILSDIMSRLCPTYQARFRAVCKNWLAAHPVNPNIYMPWYVKFDRLFPIVNNMLQFRLFDPISSSYVPNLASIQNISLSKLCIPAPASYTNIGATPKNNWLFICISRPRLYFWTRRYFLLLSPFTKELIKLPELDYPSRFKFRRTFSTKPDSPDCVFFLSNASDAEKIVVVTYRKGDKDWKAREFDRVDDFVPCSCTPIYFRGILYIVSPYGQLASYNIGDGEFKFENLIIDELFAVNYDSYMLYEVFELNGELMLIYFGSEKMTVDTFLGKQCIKRYDWSNNVWIPVKNLGDKALFVSDKIVSVPTIDTEHMKNNGVISNKIYRFVDCGCIIYSLKDGELVEFKSVNLNLEDGGGDLPEYKYNCGITFWDATKGVYWLDPPVVLY